MNEVHPTAIIGPRVLMGDGNKIGPYCVFDGQVIIGSNNSFDPFCTIGGKAEHKTQEGQGSVMIGSRNQFGEAVNIHAALEGEEATVVENYCYVMVGAHIGHDAIIQNQSILSSHCIVGGHSIIMRGSNLGLGSIVHQNRVVGPYGMVGMNSTVTKSLPPFMVSWGSPAKPYRVNDVGMIRANLEEETMRSAAAWWSSQQTGIAVTSPIDEALSKILLEWKYQLEASGGK